MFITSGSWKDKETRLRSVTKGNFSNDELVTEFSSKISFQCMSIERHEMNTMVITGSNQKKKKTSQLANRNTKTVKTRKLPEARENACDQVVIG